MPKKALQESVHKFLAEHGWEEGESFASFVRDYRRDHWPEPNSLGGAMTLLPRFLETRDERAEQQRTESAHARERKWNAYFDEALDRLRGELLERIAKFEAELHADRDYLFWSEAAQGLHTTGSNANRPRHADVARKILRTKSATTFRDQAIKPLAEWLDPRASKRSIEAAALTAARGHLASGDCLPPLPPSICVASPLIHGFSLCGSILHCWVRLRGRNGG